MIWDEDKQFDNTIWVKRYTPGQGWSTAEIISATDAYEPRIAIDANGNAIAVWYQSGVSRDNIRTNRFE